MRSRGSRGAGFKRLGILGTRWLLESSVYAERFAARGLERGHPDAAEINELTASSSTS